jgi:hypothetical protein
LLSKDINHVKVGEALGSLLLTKIPDIELRDIVDEDLSQQRISHIMLKYIMTNNVRMKNHMTEIDERMEELNAEIEEVRQIAEKKPAAQPSTSGVDTTKVEVMEKSLRGVIEKLTQDIASSKIKTDASFISINEELKRLQETTAVERSH